MIEKLVIIYFSYLITLSLVFLVYLFHYKFDLPKRLLAFFLILVLFPLPLVYFYYTIFVSVPEVVVPDLKGLPLRVALTSLEVSGLKGVKAGTLYHPQITFEAIVKQEPQPGRIVKAGRIIRLMTSSGQRKIIVPNLLGRKLNQAKEVVLAQGLSLAQVEKSFAPDFEPEVILKQTPLPGEEVAAGSSIELVVATTLEPSSSSSEAEERGFFLW